MEHEKHKILSYKIETIINTDDGLDITSGEEEELSIKP